MNNQKIQSILIVSVGGSHQPIVKAIRELQPDYVVFVCSGADPATGQQGSDIQINGKGNCIKAHHQDDNPSLPAIPQQVSIELGRYCLITTVSDDLDQIYLDCTQAIKQISKQYPGAKILADYTGGTKSMSAGLIMAALEFPDIDLQLVTGNRSDLIKVHDGAESSAPANIEQIRFQRMTAPHQQCWNRFAYSEAVEGIKTIQNPRQRNLRAQYNRFKDLSQSFAEWDNFNHAFTLDVLKRYAPNLPSHLKPYISIVQRLNDHNEQKKDAARLCDLYLNALRRASQGRYDDAVARIYRLIEWTAQWILKYQCQIDTADLQKEQFEAILDLSENRDGKFQVGLMQAWQLVKHKTQGAAAEFISENEHTLLNHIKMRNQSILAHGYQAIHAEKWHTLSDFLSTTFILMLLAETKAVGIITLPIQLPVNYTADYL